MSQVKHTPGPWKALVARHTPDSPAFGFAVRAEGKNPAVTSAAVYEEHVLILSIPECQYEAYEKAMPEQCAKYFTPQEVEANAHLIAAAPDLLEALKAMLLSFYESEEGRCLECGEAVGTEAGCESCFVFEKANQAIAKAEWRQP